MNNPGNRLARHDTTYTCTPAPGTAGLLTGAGDSLYTRPRSGTINPMHGYKNDGSPGGRHTISAGAPDLKPAAQLSPAFGQANLTNCEREQIHLPGSIQPHGALLVLREDDLSILQASANAAAFLGIGDATLPGRGLADICPDIESRIRARSGDTLKDMPSNFRCATGHDRRVMDALLHRSDDGHLIIEFLPAESQTGLAERVQRAMQAIPGGKSLMETCADAAEIFYELTGYDRVMVYRFDDDGHGRVIAETFEKDLEAYLGNRYPASDIPQIARQLYLRNRVRMLVDVGYTPVRIEPRLSPLTGRELDMSMCFLRSISPLHTQYLKNMGVAATLVVSIVVNGRLWGLIACHHYSPRAIPCSVNAACEFLAEGLATRIAAFEAHAEAQVDWSVRRFETHMIESMSRYGDWKTVLFNGSQHLLKPLEAGGAVLFIDNEIFTTGDVPGTHDLREIRDWLGRQSPEGLYHTTSLGEHSEQFRHFAEVASGLVSVPVSKAPGEFLIWFRPQQLRTDIWGGNPSKAIVMGDDPADLSPRRSFAKWYQEVEGTSMPWTSAALNVAARIGQTVADTVLHFRSVRALIAEDQLNKAIRQVGDSDLPVIITDSGRRILLANEAFHSLLPAGVPHLDRLEDLPSLFTDPGAFRRSLTDLCDRQLVWRGEVMLKNGGEGPLKLLLRADPVLVPPHRVLGYILMFTDMSELKAVEDARRRFQELIMSESAAAVTASESADDLMHRNLLSAVVGNAQVAALEITDGVDVARIPEMLESVRGSVGRSAELLKHLIWYLQDENGERHDPE